MAPEIWLALICGRWAKATAASEGSEITVRPQQLPTLWRNSWSLQRRSGPSPAARKGPLLHSAQHPVTASSRTLARRGPEQHRGQRVYVKDIGQTLLANTAGSEEESPCPALPAAHH
eukprot:scaffold4314_cov388-Prasinococcus_capsulatus_cf.AAC.3